MYFKKLEIIGFKSFLDKTVVQFEPGVTAIVGPNGCGKSNIADAMRWVLGEQSAKSLRGSSMEDVIFNGSASKEALNLAEVSLTLSNESKLLPIDYEEVTITRRLYRSGDSEYLLNKNLVRLKDIQELIMGTGIGTDSYSIIEQGKMDLILNSKPEERREIFEEAAGITKFKSKKKEALRKLEQTESNLVRIHDILTEVRRSIGSVERQAKKAENYKIEFEKLKKLDLAVAAFDFGEWEKRRKVSEEGLRSLKEKERDFLASLEAIEKEWQKENQGLAVIEAGLQECQRKELEAGSEIRRNQDRLLLNRERIGELAARRGELFNQISFSKKRVEELSLQAHQLQGEYEKIAVEVGEGQKFLDSVEAEFADLEKAVSDSFLGERSLKSGLLDLASQKAREQTELAKIQAELHSLGLRRKRLQLEEASLLKESEETTIQMRSAFGEVGGDGGTAVPKLESKVQDFKTKLKTLLRDLWSKWSAVKEEKDEGLLPDVEERILESNIREFAEGVLEDQAQIAEERGRMRHIQEQQKKLAERLSLLQVELSELTVEESHLFQKEKGIGENFATIAGEETKVLSQIASGEETRRQKASQKEALLVRLTQTRVAQSQSAALREKAQKDFLWASQTKAAEEERVLAFQSEEGELSGKREALEADNLNLEKETQRLSVLKEESLRKAERLRLEKEQADQALSAIGREKHQKETFLREASSQAHALELEAAEIRYQMHGLKERIFNAYQVDLTPETLSEFQCEGSLEEIRTDVQAQREKLNKMGPVNLVAIQEYDEMKERFDFLNQQEQDLLLAKEDLHKAILKINRTTRELFTETFEKVRGFFSEYYRLLFGGGSAELLLLDEADVLESGIDIVARPPGKKLQSISLLSGGEKALTAIALLFALFKVKPSPFCVLDEIDAPLDESNVDRFCGVLKEFTVGSQFILITHNKRTMNLADVLYGITMSETGISKIVSVRFSEKSQNALERDLNKARGTETVSAVN